MNLFSRSHKKTVFTFISLITIFGYGYFVYAAAPSGGYTPGQTLNPDCAPGDTDCFVNLPSGGGGSGWSLTGDAGTTAGTNFLGTTDAQDFMIKTNSNTVARFGQTGDVELGSDFFFFTKSTSTNNGAMSWGWLGEASGEGSTVFGLENIAAGDLSTVFGESNEAIGAKATAFGYDNSINGDYSTVFGRRNIVTGQTALAFGRENFARSYVETSFGMYGTDYTATNAGGYSPLDRLVSIGNGQSGGAGSHNAYTLWKDGSFAYNDDNFQNDNAGTEQNMFYFNYGNHDGLGGAQTNSAIRLGSSRDVEWDINSGNVGDRSIAIGFAVTYPADIFFTGYPQIDATGPVASGLGSLALTAGANAEGVGSLAMGTGAQALGTGSVAIGLFSEATNSFDVAIGIGSIASGNGSFAFGATATGIGSYAFGGDSIASARNSFTLGTNVLAKSDFEIAMGLYPTDDTSGSNQRLFTIGDGSNGTFVRSDAFSILKDGRTGVAIDQFQTNALGAGTSLFQVGDGTTNIIGYVNATTGNWMAVSDERKKHNINDLSYGLDQVLALRPVAFDYNRNNEHTIGFLAQQVLGIVPEAVGGSEEAGYSMSYATLTPVLVKAIQEMNLKITTINDMNTPNTWRDALIVWFENASNGIRKIFVGEVHTNVLCVGQTCVSESQLQQLLQNQNIQNTTPVIPVVIDSPTDTPPADVIPDDTETLLDTPTENQENTVTPPDAPVEDQGDTVANVSNDDVVVE